MNRVRSVALVTITALLAGPGALRAQTPALQWSQSFGSAGGGSQLVTNVAANANGVYVAGTFHGDIDLGGSLLVSAGLEDIVLGKFDTAGGHLWSKSFGSAQPQNATAIAVDGTGAVYITGQLSNTIDFGGGVLTSAGGYDTYLAKFNTDGVHQWSKVFGDVSSNQTPQALAVDGANNVYLAGYFEGTMNFGGVNLTTAGSFDIYVAKFNSAGTHQWSQKFGDASTQYASALAIGPTDVVYLAGYYTGVVNFGGGNLTSAGTSDAYLAKFNSAGTHQWSKRFGDASNQYVDDVETDLSGNVHLFGDFYGGIDLGGGTLTSSGSSDLYIAKFNSSGTHQWSKRFGDSGTQFASAVEANSSGVFLAGYYDGVVNFGGGDLVNEGGTNDDIYFARLDAPTGAHEWSARYGSRLGNDHAFDLTLNGNNLFLCGDFDRELSLGFGSALVSPLRDDDAYLARFSPEATEPVIAAVEDVGNDQGGKVMITFERSGYDVSTTPVAVRGYEIYLRDDPLPTATAARAVTGDAWILMGAVPPHGYARYITMSATLADSTVANGGHLSYFKVRAITDDPAVHFDSPVAGGFSRDNLAPAVPENFLLAGGVLSWTAPAGETAAHYTVYGAASARFDETAVAIDRAYGTRLALGDVSFAYYFVTATDAAGNEGRPATVQGHGGGGGGIPRALSLSAFPNPFNPATTLRYTLPVAGRVSIVVFDARGMRVAGLVDRDQPAGAYRARWDGRDDGGAPVGSGVYFARVTHGGASRACKLVLLK